MAAPLGNKNFVKNKPWAEAIARALARKAKGKQDGLNLVADQLVAAALNGDQWAIKEIGERTDGKAAQSVTVAGDQDKPLIHRIECVIVDPAD